jgi:ribonuclease HI
MKREKIIMYTDGGSRGNPGNAGAGAVIFAEDGTKIKGAHKALGVMTNNEAEYEAIILAFDLAKKVFGKEKLVNMDVELRADSELLVKQLNGIYQIKEERFFSYFMKIWNARITTFPHMVIKHIPREQNKEADSLANEAMDGAQTLL